MGGLGFVALAEKHHDFAVPEDRLARPALGTFRQILAEPATREALTALGFAPES